MAVKPTFRTLYAMTDTEFPITVEQSGKRCFRVTYGLQVKVFSNWKNAFEELGYCLAHALECSGTLTR